MKLSIIANPEKYSVQSPIGRVLDWCDENRAKAYMAKQLVDHFPGNLSTSSISVTETEEETVSQSEIVIAIGGDGTMLHTAHLVKEASKPVLGINTGKLGFMANIQPELIEDALHLIRKNEFIVDQRSLLQAKSKSGKTWYALNEFLFTKKDTSSMISLLAEYNGELINNYWADGLIISSPTGSTAYNLSAGGPIVLPGTPVMVLTPINPHTLTTRPLVLPSDGILTIKSVDSTENILFSYDGEILPDGNSFNIQITNSDYSVRLIRLPNQNYFETLRNKLMWGVDKRQK